MGQLKNQVREILELVRRCKEEREEARQVPGNSVWGTGGAFFGGLEVISIKEASAVMNSR
jgi:hypothetical protein